MEETGIEVWNAGRRLMLREQAEKVIVNDNFVIRRMIQE